MAQKWSQRGSKTIKDFQQCIGMKLSNVQLWQKKKKRFKKTFYTHL